MIKVAADDNPTGEPEFDPYHDNALGHVSQNINDMFTKLYEVDYEGF